MSQETQQNQEVTPESDVVGVVMMPHIEEDVPIPKNSHEALPSMSNEEEVVVRATTYKELTDLTGDTIDPTPEDREKAEALAQEMAKNPNKKQDIALYPNEQIAYLAGMVGIYNHMAVKDLAELKLYVVNKLINAAESTQNVKEQIAALRSIGEVDGVDAFKKKTEVTHKVESMEEVEKELLAMLSELKEKQLLKKAPETIDAEIVEEPTDE